MLTIYKLHLFFFNKRTPNWVFTLFWESLLKQLFLLVQVLEELYCKTWTKFDGLGALIITPTRELALQLYETLIKVGKYHDFSAGLIIGDVFI